MVGEKGTTMKICLDINEVAAAIGAYAASRGALAGWGYGVLPVTVTFHVDGDSKFVGATVEPRHEGTT